MLIPVHAYIHNIAAKAGRKETMNILQQHRRVDFGPFADCLLLKMAQLQKTVSAEFSGKFSALRDEGVCFRHRRQGIVLAIVKAQLNLPYLKEEETDFNRENELMTSLN